MPADNWLKGARSYPSLEEARSKALQSGIRYVENVGLALGMTAGVIERICDGAGVTSAQFMKLWASNDEFFTDLFVELANQAQVDRADSETLLTTWQYISGRTGDLNSAEGRRQVLLDVIRTAAEYNFDVVTASSKWRTYAAISTTISSWPTSESRTRVIDALRASELAFVETMESFYRNVLPTLGFRLKPEFGNDYQPFVVATASVIEGLGIVRASVPALVQTHFDLPNNGGEVTWSVAALAFVGVLDAFIEPDPEFTAEAAIARLHGGVDVTPRED